ncbi:hypothetical protein CPC08DRAFT_707305 [Agrocybe pediades]|nr:hypothetical protein CPC08DRAFT_707305 [Agrocybe pediades]
MNERVTPRAIAYAAVQLLFALSDAHDWTDRHCGFNYARFYYFVIDFFEDAVDPISRAAVEQLLLWWNRKIYGEFSHSQDEAEDVPSTSEEILKKRREERAREHAASQAPASGGNV